MRRLSKIIVFIAACSAATVVTWCRHDDGIRVGADNQLRAATRPLAGQIRPRPAPDLLEDAVLRARELLRQEPAGSEADAGGRARFRPARRARDPDRPLARARSQAGHGQGQRPAAQLLDRTRRRALEPAQHAAGDLPASCSRNLQPVPDKEESRRLVEIEMAATNGMLYTLDPHSVLLDVESVQGHAHADPGQVRRSRHRHRDGQEEPHHGQAADARHARHPGRHQGQGSHRPHQQRIDDEHDLATRRSSACAATSTPTSTSTSSATPRRA